MAATCLSIFPADTAEHFSGFLAASVWTGPRKANDLNLCFRNIGGICEVESHDPIPPLKV